jgi:signal peptidase II
MRSRTAKPRRDAVRIISDLIMTEPPDQRTGTRTAPTSAARHPPAVLRFMIAALLLLATDLIVKHYAFEHVAGRPVSLERDASGQLPPIPPHGQVTVIPRVLALHLTLNQGAVFGLGQGGRWVFVAFSVVAAVVLVLVFAPSRPDSRLLHLALGAVLAGALGNLYDRLAYGVVRDMLHLFPGVRLPFGWRWPDGSNEVYPWIFNVADACLVIGLIVLLFLMYRHDRRGGKAKTLKAES